MKIITVPNHVLDKKTKDVTSFDQKLAKIVNKMLDIKKQKDAVGLAANQIGISYQIAVTGFEDKENEKVSIPEMILINPRITWKSNNLLTQKERCLSVNDKDYDVPRSKKIHIQYQDLDGKKIKFNARGILARIIQHEIDHLNGIKISDYQ